MQQQEQEQEQLTDDAVLQQMLGRGSRKRRVKGKQHRPPPTLLPSLALCVQPLDWPLQPGPDEGHDTLDPGDVAVEAAPELMYASEQDYIHAGGPVQPRNEAAARYAARASLALLRGEHADAVAAASAALRHRLTVSNRTAVLETRASALLGLGDAHAALQDLSELLCERARMHESDARLWCRAATAAGAHDAALRAAQYCVLHHTAGIPTWMDLCACYTRLRRCDEAAMALTQARVRMQRLRGRDKPGWLVSAAEMWNERFAAAHASIEAARAETGDAAATAEPEIDLPALFHSVTDAKLHAKLIHMPGGDEDDEADHSSPSSASVLDM